MELGVALILVAVALFAVAVLLRRGRSARGEAAPTRSARSRTEPDIDVVRPRPQVAELHVYGEEARVTFSVPLPPEPDEVLTELLVHEAVEIVREKRHTLPMSQVTRVSAYAMRQSQPVKVGETALDAPGELPPRAEMPSILNLTSIAPDPLEEQFSDRIDALPSTMEPPKADVLAPLAKEVRLPKAVTTGLRAQGIDPEKVTAGELVAGMLSLFGYRVTPGPAERTWLAEKGGTVTYIREDPYRPGDHPEVGEETLRRFLVEFTTSGHDRGLFVSEKFGPFAVYDMERREPRIRFVTRERLQKLIDALALG